MIKVIRAKDLIKYFIRILIPIIIIVVIFNAFSKSKVKKANGSNNEENNVQEKNSEENAEKNKNEEILQEVDSNENVKEGDNNKEEKKALIGCMKEVLTEIKLEDEEDNQNEKKKRYAFLSELEIMESLKEESDESGKSENQDNNQNENNIDTNNEGVTKARTDVTTEIIPNNVNPRVTNEYNGVKVNNMSDHTLTEDMLVPNIEVNNKKVGIYHTHTCESYTPTENYNYTASGNFRSVDLNYSVARVGDELNKQLTSYGIQVVHDKTYHDYPAYNGSYGRSLTTSQSIKSNNQDADIIIDLHRDAIGDESYAPKVKIGEEYVSQLMFVIGGNNENWNQNLKFAIKVMEKSNELYPGLFKPIILRNAEYNQHVSKASCIIEVGATGNTLEESMNAMKYLAKIISEI